MKRMICMLLTLCLLAGLSLAGAESPAPRGKPWINSNLYGNWPSEHPGPEISFDLYVNFDKYQEAPAQSSQPAINGFVKTNQYIYSQLESLCQDPEKNGTEDECLRILYGLYMDTEKRAQDGFESLRAHAGRLRAVKTPDELIALIREEGYLYGDALYEAAFGAERREDSSVYYVQLNYFPIIDDLPPDEETFESPGKDIDGAREKLLRMGFAEEEIPRLIEGILSYPGGKEITAETDLETELNSRTEGMASLEEIREVCPPAWEMIRAQGLVKEDRGTELLYRFNFSDMIRIRNLFTEENLETLKAMLALGMYKSAEKVLPGETESDERPGFLTFLSFTPQVLYEQAFVHNFVPRERIDIYSQLVDEYKDAMRIRIGQNSRLSEESKQKALTKLEHLIGSEILYPYGEIDCGSLLEALRSCKDLLEANGQCRQLERKEMMHYTGREIVRGNRYNSNNGVILEEGQYLPSFNVFYIGAGALVGEMADFTSRETILGTLGLHLAHELSHGFDTYGSRYDEFGREYDESTTTGYLFTEEDLKAYQERAKAIAGQISQTDMWDGNNLNGERMIGEVMADLTSVSLAMDLAKKAEHFDYDAYFRAMASAWYAVYYSRDAMLGYYSEEVHPPHYFRINFTLPHFEEFYQTYPSVTEGTPMYIAPEDRILPW